MTNSQSNKSDGENKNPAFRQSASLLEGAASSNRKILADGAPPPANPGKLANLCASLENSCREAVPVGSCRQKLWFSFFFDGTGNNLNADLAGNKHSSVAKLYRAHRGDENNGGDSPGIKDGTASTFRIYIPGIGTYFKAVNDGGGSDMGLGVGLWGSRRLAWAFKQFDQKMKHPMRLASNPANKIEEINIAVFGFSRGAALARAFIFEFVKDRCKYGKLSKSLYLTEGMHPLRVRFMGLYDTVASVGSPMAANTLNNVDGDFKWGDHESHIFKRFEFYKPTIPTHMAFALGGRAGADPAPGLSNGHADWGDHMLIPEMVEEVHHFIAGHEQRNSFPVDSISVEDDGEYIKHPNFYEYVYPGVHSDVGGSYRPGEGGKGEIPAMKLGLIPLKTMYDLAVKAGVPLLPECAFTNFNKADFKVDDKVLKDYAYYLSHLKPKGNSVGELFHAHMKLYYEWRFYKISRKINGNHSENNRIIKNEGRFKRERDALEKLVKVAEKEYKEAWNAVTDERQARQVAYSLTLKIENRKEKDAKFASWDGMIADKQLKERLAKDKLLNAKANLASVQDMSRLDKLVDFYDQTLMKDAIALYKILQEKKSTYKRWGFDQAWDTMRPHYKVLVKAYHNEFMLKDSGMRDKQLIAFFDEYVHDSIAGFGMDSTLRSDPRVIYVGGNNKLDFASVTPLTPSSPMDGGPAVTTILFA